MASQTALCDVNDLRYQMFRIKIGDVDSGQLPPCKFKDRDSTAPKRGSVFIGLMTPDGAIWSRYQRAVLMR